MKIETKFKIGDIVDYQFMDYEPYKFLIVMITIKADGVLYWNGTDTHRSECARENELS
jgi:hypothetical protein